MNSHDTMRNKHDIHNGEETEKSGHCHVERLEKEVDTAALHSAVTSVLAITGMGCPNCALRVHNALLSLPDVYEVKIDLERALVFVRWTAQEQQPDRLIEAVSQAAVGTHHNYHAYFLDERTGSLEGELNGP